MACEEVFVRQLHERGYRLTPQRKAVLSLLHNVEGFVTADLIYAHVRERCPHVDMSTVYRTLDLLTHLELVVMLDTGEGQRQYELVGAHGLHHHLHCTACDATLRLDDQVLAPLVREIRDQYGFAVQSGSLMLTGLCVACQAKIAEQAATGELASEQSVS